jgi:serine/threonine protein kinase
VTATAANLNEAMSLEPGSRLGRYCVLRPLAIGGMAEVYLACAAGVEGFEKRVVIKRVLPQFSVNADFVKMFLNEARLTSMLDHPNIVQVHDMGDHGGSYYLAMEYIRGQDVREILKRAQSTKTRMPLDCVASVAIRALAGLHYAHEAVDHEGNALNIIHRDVSLSNILVSYDGGVKLVDFGIAKAAASNVNTSTGTLKGKLAYMSPEQCRNESLDRRSDIFAMGIVLYEMATGSRLFAGASEYEIIQKIANTKIEPPNERCPELPDELCRIIMKALQHKREDRYSTALEVQNDLRRFAKAEGLSTSTFDLAEYMSEFFAEDIVNEPSDSGLREIIAAAGSGSHRSIELELSEGTRSLTPAPINTAMFAASLEEHEESEPEIDVVLVEKKRGWKKRIPLIATSGLAFLMTVLLFIQGNDSEAPAPSQAADTTHFVAPATGGPETPPVALGVVEADNPSTDASGERPTSVELGSEQKKRDAQAGQESKNQDTATPTTEATAEKTKAKRNKTRKRRAKKKRAINSKDKDEGKWNANSALLPSL